MNERWLPVPNWVGYYEVSDQGRVRSVDRVITRTDGKLKRWKGVLLSNRPGFAGYVTVHPRRGPEVWTIRVHLLVLDVFVGERPPGAEACHNNGNPSDNRVENLRWDSPAGNARDTIRHGRNHQLLKKYCPSGHPYIASNIYSEKQGHARRCRTCHNNRCREYQSRRRANHKETV